MLPIIVLFLPIAILLLLMVVVFMFLTMIIEGPARQPSHDPRGRWRPPQASGPELMAWGEKMTQSVTQKLLSQPRTNATATRVADEILSAASFAIRNLPQMVGDEKMFFCPNSTFRRVDVTAPEILAVADKIRPDRAEAMRIHDLAAKNAERLAGPTCDVMDAEPMACPLRTNEGQCAAQRLCPLYCRTACNLTDEFTSDDANTSSSMAHALNHGIELGLSRGLEAAGLDGHIYELNSALAVALETPDASERWAEGEDILAGCMRKAV